MLVLIQAKLIELKTFWMMRLAHGSHVFHYKSSPQDVKALKVSLGWLCNLWSKNKTLKLGPVYWLLKSCRYVSYLYLLMESITILITKISFESAASCTDDVST